MDRLTSDQDKLCMWLSGDSDNILMQCGNLLSMNDFFEVQKQITPQEKMRLLLKIITQKGADTYQGFLGIVAQHLANYQQLQQCATQGTGGSPGPTVFTDSNSIVTMRDIRNINVKTVSMNIDKVSDPRNGLTGNAAGPVPQADYIARGGSVICADRISNANIDVFDLSVTMKHGQEGAGTASGTLPSPQGPAVKAITAHKVELIDCLRADHRFILQHVHAKFIVKERQYEKLMHISQPEETIIVLMDQLIGNGQESCRLFIKLLTEPVVVQTYPQLEAITKQLEEQCISNNGNAVGQEDMDF